MKPSKIFADTPHIDTLLSGTESVCRQCMQWESNCKCPASYAGGDC